MARTVKYKTEVRSNFVAPQPGQLAASSNPCAAKDGYYWVHAYPKTPAASMDLRATGKWLVRMDCPYVEAFWGMIHAATEEGTLGIGSKISTDWAMSSDPSGTWRKHVVCVYTKDWRQKDDVFRVAQRLHAICAVKKMMLTYKPDVFTFDGRYEGNAAGEVAIYTCRAPYAVLDEDHRQLAEAEALLTKSGPAG